MESYQFEDLSITLEKQGARQYSKVSYPIRYGCYSEIKTADHVFEVNLKGEIKHLQGRGSDWPHSTEWLKRTVGNDWMYYSAGDYKEVLELFGEYYFPCLSYPSNSIMGENPFKGVPVKTAILSWENLQKRIRGLTSQGLRPRLKTFLASIAQNDERKLRTSAQIFHEIMGGRVTVLPPDSRHVDYEVIPVIVADGCLYHCGFCRVKSGQEFTLRTRENVFEQILNLRKFYGPDLPNYNALFLGHHDALQVGREFLELAAIKAYQLFTFERSYMKNPRLFLFGSADSLLGAEEALFESLNQLPYHTYINVGLESADPKTLALLKKPLSVEKVNEAFVRIKEINRAYEQIDVTVNFVWSSDLPESHFSSLLDLAGKSSDVFRRKGGVYLSPLVREETKRQERKRDLVRRFNELKTEIPVPAFIYLIQRL